jgi:hypothetical protein
MNAKQKGKELRTSMNLSGPTAPEPVSGLAVNAIGHTWSRHCQATHSDSNLRFAGEAALLATVASAGKSPSGTGAVSSAGKYEPVPPHHSMSNPYASLPCRKLSDISEDSWCAGWPRAKRWRTTLDPLCGICWGTKMNDEEREFRQRPGKPRVTKPGHEGFIPLAAGFRMLMHYARQSGTNRKGFSAGMPQSPHGQRCAVRITYSRNTVQGQWLGRMVGEISEDPLTGRDGAVTPGKDQQVAGNEAEESGT